MRNGMYPQTPQMQQQQQLNNSIAEVKALMAQVKNAPNPQALLAQMLQSNPNTAMIAKMLSSNGSLESIARSMAQDRGIDIMQLINSLQGGCL